MKRKSFFSNVVSVLGVIIVIGVAWGFDAMLQFFNQQRAQTFTIAWNLIYIWADTLFNLLLAAILLLLSWFILSQTPRYVWIALIYLIVGLYIVAFPALNITLAICCKVTDISFFPLSPTLYVFSAGGFIAIIGLLALILPKGNPLDSV